jgi:hypothetical protein
LNAIAALSLLACGRVGFDALPFAQQPDSGPLPDAVVACPLPTGEAESCTTGTCFYIAPSGGDDANPGTSAAAPWASFSHAWTQLQPGQTLVLLDGVYTRNLSPTISGSAGSPITIRAANDGQAILDGEFMRSPCWFNNVSYLNIEGIQCKNLNAAATNTSLFQIGNANNIVVRRVSLHEANDGASLMLVYRSSEVLVEDSIGSGRARDFFHTYASSQVTFRRLFGVLPTVNDNGSGVANVQLSGSDDVLVENCLAFATSPSNNFDSSAIAVSGSSDGGNRNRLIGNIGFKIPDWTFWVGSGGTRIQDNLWRDNVSIDGDLGLFQRSDANMEVQRLTVAGADGVSFSLRPLDAATPDPDFEVNGKLRNSVFLGPGAGISYAPLTFTASIDHDYNLISGGDQPHRGTAPGDNELVDAVLPRYDTATYGKGAYLIAPANLASAGEGGGRMGAEVLYRTVDGSLSCQPLWPWPMEERVLGELGMSPTFDVAGGLWATLDGLYD